jgi:phosphoserine phosphatase
MISALKNNPYRPGAVELVKWFRDKGYATLAISSGLDFLNAVACKDLGISYHISNKLAFDADDNCLGTVQICVNETNKGEVLEKYLRDSFTRYHHVFAVGDGIGDIPMFRVADSSLAYMPVNDVVRRAATYSAESLEDSKKLLDGFYRSFPFAPTKKGDTVMAPPIIPK